MKLKSLMKEETPIKALVTYKVATKIAGETVIISMIEEDNKKVSVIKYNGQTIASYQYTDDGVVSVKSLDDKKVCDALAALIYKFSGK